MASTSVLALGVDLTTAAQPLPFKLRHSYGIGALALSLVNTCVLLFYAKHLVDNAGLSPAVVGTVLMVGKVWDAVTDPVVGRWVDRTRTTMGSRRPWLLFGAIPFVAVFLALWQPIPLDGWARVSAAALILMLYNTAYTCVVVPYGALTPSLATTYDTRTQLNAARMGYSMLGGVVAGVMLPTLRDGWGGGYVPGTMVLAVLALPCMGVLFVGTQGLDRPTPARAGNTHGSVFAVPEFWRVTWLFLAGWSSLSTVAAMLPFYIQHYVGRPDLEDLMFGAIQLAGMASIIPVAVAAQRTSKHRTFAVCMASWAVLFGSLAVIPTGDYRPVLLTMLLAGPGVAAAHVIPWSILPDVVAIDAERVGVDRSGAFYGAMTFVEKLASALALQIALLCIQMGGYIPKAEVQSPEAIRVVALTIGVFPGVLVTLAALYAWFGRPVRQR